MVVLVMGVAGAGKTTVGQLLASQLGWKFVDGDRYHSPENIQKMHAGIPLTDEDRVPWLASLRASIQEWLSADKNVVLAASMLKRKYRDEVLLSPDVKLVYLRVAPDLIRARLLHRQHHFMNAALVESQFADLEEPDNAFIVDAAKASTQIVSDIRNQLGL